MLVGMSHRAIITVGTRAWLARSASNRPQCKDPGFNQLGLVDHHHGASATRAALLLVTGPTIIE